MSASSYEELGKRSNGSARGRSRRAEKEQPAPGSGGATRDIVLAELPATEPHLLPPAEWLYANFLLAGEASCLGGADGVGKGAITVSMILAVITGRNLLGEHVWYTGTVAILTFEDTPETWRKRIAAACIYHRVDYSSVMPKIRFVKAKQEGERITFLRLEDGQPVAPHTAGLVEVLREWGPVLLVIDPFNHAHQLPDGNSNAAVARVAAEIVSVAQTLRLAVLLLHHLRKGSDGTVDDLMGATALRATFRATRIIKRMTDEEAKELEVEDRRQHVRIADSKDNYGPPADTATWWKLVGIPLNNGTPRYPAGDNIVVATSWAPPAAFDGVPMTECVRVVERIGQGLADGRRFTSHRHTGTRGAASFVADELGIGQAKAVQIVKTWVESGLLRSEQYTRPGHGAEPEQGLVVDHEKLAAMAGTVP